MALSLYPAPLALSAAHVSLDCKIDDPSGRLASGFEAEFCAALAHHLRRDAQLVVGERTTGGRNITVTLRPRSEFAADVDISVSATSAQSPSATTTASSVLSSHDRPLTPYSARTLVLPIVNLLKT